MSSDAKTTKSYKLSPELKEKLERLAADSGLETQEAFIEQLAALYELQQMKEGHGSGYAKQIEELEYHTRRSVELFIGVINTESAERLQMNQEHEEKLSDRAAVIFSQEQEIAELRKELKMRTDELERMSKEKEAQARLNEQLETAARDKGLLVDQYREKVDTLSGLVSEYKEAAEENKTLHLEISRMTMFTEKQDGRISSLEAEMAELSKHTEEQMRQAEERHKELLERMTERKETEKEREVLKVRTEYQEKLEAAQTEATAKIRELYDQLERQRSLHEEQVRQIHQNVAKDQQTLPPSDNDNI